MRAVPPDKLRAVLAVLADEDPASQGDRVYTLPDDPVDELVGTILSQHTRDSGAAHAALRATFPTWDALRAAPETLVAEVIWSSGLARVKAHRIHLTLNGLAEANGGQVTLAPLAAAPLADARRWLATLPGVGPKTAACVLLFGLGRPALPVDDHVHRCVTRLGLVQAGLTPTQSHAALETALGDDTAAVRLLHTRLHRLSREMCRRDAPRCTECPLAPCCDFA